MELASNFASESCSKNMTFKQVLGTRCLEGHVLNLIRLVINKYVYTYDFLQLEKYFQMNYKEISTCNSLHITMRLIDSDCIRSYKAC